MWRCTDMRLHTLGGLLACTRARAITSHKLVSVPTRLQGLVLKALAPAVALGVPGGHQASSRGEPVSLPHDCFAYSDSRAQARQQTSSEAEQTGKPSGGKHEQVGSGSRPGSASAARSTRYHPAIFVFNLCRERLFSTDPGKSQNTCKIASNSGHM
jgi:hypothetical protein